MSGHYIIDIVDDDIGVRNSLAFLLSTSGFPARTHESATAFLAFASRLEKSCLITDVRMPDMTGIELLLRLREARLPIAVILVSGHGDVQMAVEAMKNGAVDFIEKPFDDAVLLRAVSRAMDLMANGAANEREREDVRKRIGRLSEREREVLAGVVEGQHNKAIARQLDLSPRTVEVYRASLMAKMGARNLAELVRMTMDMPSGFGPGTSG